MTYLGIAIASAVLIWWGGYHGLPMFLCWLVERTPDDDGFPDPANRVP